VPAGRTQPNRGPRPKGRGRPQLARHPHGGWASRWRAPMQRSVGGAVAVRYGV